MMSQLLLCVGSEKDIVRVYNLIHLSTNRSQNSRVVVTTIADGRAT